MIIHKKLVSISSCNYKASSFDTVYEWEKIISEKLNLKIQKQSNILNWIYRQIELRLRARDLFEYLVPRSSCSLLFVMTVNLAKSCRLSKNAIPIIIDDLNLFSIRI